MTSTVICGVSTSYFFAFYRGFGRIMGDSAMVIMWPSRYAEDGTYASVMLSQRNAPLETMPRPTPTCHSMTTF
jgi:hypothetical protein